MKDEEVGEVIFGIFAFIVFVISFSITAGIVSLIEAF